VEDIAQLKRKVLMEGPAKRSVLLLTRAIGTFINASLGSDCRTGLRVRALREWQRVFDGSLASLQTIKREKDKAGGCRDRQSTIPIVTLSCGA